MTHLQERLTPARGGWFLSQKEWDDELPNLLKADGIKVQIVERGRILRLPDFDAEIAYIHIPGASKDSWQVCYNWIPLWQMRKWEDCLADNRRHLYPTTDFYAVPPDCTEEERAVGTEKLEALGFVVSESFEGF